MGGLHRWAALAAACVALAGASARAQTCDPTTCAAMSMNTACNMSQYSCQYIDFGFGGGGGYYCIPNPYNLPPVGTACETDNNACTTDACGGTAGQTSGDGVCHHTAVANGTVCGSNGTCTNGTCVCAAGYKMCSGACIANAGCCTNSDCSSLTNTATHTRGVCPSPGGSCVSTCAAGYKACAGACIPTASCCTSADCTSPPNACYQHQGTCTSGACSYAYADGTACNADNDACTSNDTCKTGSCVAGSPVTCSQRDCHTAPTCNRKTGNCDDNAVPDGTVCGANGCASAQGMCTAGTCSSPPIDCTSLDSACQVGTCDASKPVGTPCAAANKPNGLACTTNDKCILVPACSGGACTGDRKVCTPSGPCRAASCDSTSGNCVETIAPAGTPCSIPGACIESATCDDNGTCTGDPLPDGTPCENASCAVGAVCGAGTCVCADSIGTMPNQPTTTGVDAGDAPTPVGKGCSTAPGVPASPLALIIFFGLVTCASRWRTRRAR